MDQTSGTNPPDAPPAQGPLQSPPVEPTAEAEPGFRSRGQARRRARFLRRARELAYRDLGGLVFNLHRFGQRNDALVLAKLGTLGHIDSELRAIETALGERRAVTVLREAGITACPRCAAIHGSEDRFCPNCGLPMSRNADLPVAGAPGGERAPAPVAPPPTTVPAATASAVPAAAAPLPEAEAPAPVPPAPAEMPASSVEEAQSGESSAEDSEPVPAGTGRSPLPPARSGNGDASASARESADQPTEIIRPQAPGQ